MPLKLSLKPGEKFVLNGAVLANGDKRTSLIIQNKACVLREKDIMQPDEANHAGAPDLFCDHDDVSGSERGRAYYNEFALRMTEFMGAIQNKSASRAMRRDQPGCHERQLLQGAHALQKAFRIRTGAAEL